MNNNKVALVTGGMGGLGTAICRRLHTAGFKVATTYSPDNKAPDAWLAAQRDDGFHFTVLKADVSDHDDCKWALQKLLAGTGRLDVLVNNAGIARDRSQRKTVPDESTGMPHANLGKVLNMSKQAVAAMAAQKWGRIINISPVSAQRGAAGPTDCAADKAGMHGFTRSLALEVARHGITVNTVSAGYLRTRMVLQMPDAIVQDTILPQIPLGRLGEPAEVAALVAYLASEEASFVTGANIAINGGQHLA
jgi:acetoacetyl-CoA reductase